MKKMYNFSELTHWCKGISAKVAQTKLPINDGSIESVKWLALILMTADHINHFLLKMQVPVMYEIGRLAMPIFGFVLAFNLARPGAFERGIHLRTMKRLLIFGLLATPFYGVLHKWLPLNILFTLLLVTYLIYIAEKDGKDSRLLFILMFCIAGFFVEYAWFGVAYCLAAWWFCKSPNLERGLLLLAITVSLWVTNLNFWACAALPLIYLASFSNIRIPRLRFVFYAYYPIHLALLLAIQKFAAISLPA